MDGRFQIGIILNGLNQPSGIALDTNGNLYVANLGGRTVRVFLPRAHGYQHAVRTITFHGLEPEEVAVDRHGFLYVALNYKLINVYVPGANGAAQPIATISVPTNLINDMLIDRAGLLYVSEISQIPVYATPVNPFRSANTPLGVIYPEPGGFGEEIYGSIAINDSTHQIFYDTSSIVDRPPWGNLDYTVRTLPGYLYNRLNPSPAVLTRECTGSGQDPGVSYGAASLGHYLFVTCVGAASPLIYEAGPGKQPLVGSVGAGYFIAPIDIKVGP